MFSLEKTLINDYIFKLVWVVEDQGYVSLKIFAQTETGIVYLHFVNYTTWKRLSCKGILKTLSNIVNGALRVSARAIIWS